MFHSRFRPAKVKGVVFTTPSLVQSQFQSSCDISNMIARALRGDQSVFSHPRFMDIRNAPESFQDAMNRLASAKSVWNDLPDSLKQAYGSPDRLLSEFDRFIEERSNPSSSSSETSVSVTPIKAESSSTEVPHSNT